MHPSVLKGGCITIYCAAQFKENRAGNSVCGLSATLSLDGTRVIDKSQKPQKHTLLHPIVH